MSSGPETPAVELCRWPGCPRRPRGYVLQKVQERYTGSGYPKACASTRVGTLLEDGSVVGAYATGSWVRDSPVPCHAVVRLCTEHELLWRIGERPRDWGWRMRERRWRKKARRA